jgi:hypothetical protein
VLITLFGSGNLFAADQVSAYDFSFKQFFKGLGDEISVKTKQHYLQIRSLASTVDQALPVGKWLKSGNWELDLMSHKMLLDNNVPKLNLVEDSVGLELMTINRAWSVNNFTYRIGVGTVAANQSPAAEQFSWEANNGLLPTFAQDGFTMGGVASQGSVHTLIHLNRDVYVSIAGKLIYANGPTSTTGIDINQRSVHLVVGLKGLF